jgi:hypothetical protein
VRRFLARVSTTSCFAFAAAALLMMGCAAPKSGGSAETATNATATAPATASTPAPATATAANHSPQSSASQPASTAAASAAPAAPPAAPPPFPVAGLNAMGGRIFNIEPGIACNALAPFLQPGDEVRLLPGVHIPFTLADLHGERDRPIVIRGWQPEADKPLPYVRGEVFSCALLRPSHVVLRDLIVGNSTGPTVLIDGSQGAVAALAETPWDANVVVTNLSIRQENPSPSQSAIYLRTIQRADVSHIAIKGWNNSAVVLDNCAGVGVSQIIAENSDKLPQHRGVAIRAGCEDISCMYVSFGPHVQVAFELGVCDPGNATSHALAPAQRILIAHNAALDSPCFVSLGSIENSTIAFNSIIESTRVVWKADGACGVPTAITFDRNLVTWIPGRIERISQVADGIPAESIRLQRYLWWSEELPAAFEATGKPVGVELAPQVFDLNPKVEMHGFNPIEVPARDFGWTAGTTATPAAASKTPVVPSKTPAPPPTAPR